MGRVRDGRALFRVAAIAEETLRVQNGHRRTEYLALRRLRDVTRSRYSIEGCAMSSEQRDYYRRRADEERARALASRSEAIRNIHVELASLYDRLVALDARDDAIRSAPTSSVA